MKISSNGTAVGVVTCDIAKRKVIAIENLETKAGNFKAAKIAQSSLITIAVMGFPIKTEYSSEEWIYEGMVVKSIVYNKSGKKLSSTLLSYKNF